MSVVMKLVVVMFVMIMTSLKVFKTFIHGNMFNCKMTEEPTMPTAKEAAQVYAKKHAADRESKKRKRAEESEEQQEKRLAADREIKTRKRAEELPE